MGAVSRSDCAGKHPNWSLCDTGRTGAFLRVPVFAACQLLCWLKLLRRWRLAQGRQLGEDMMRNDTGHQFTTIFGRNLIGELPNFVHRPYLVVTMEDLWAKFEHLLPYPAAV